MHTKKVEIAAFACAVFVVIAITGGILQPAKIARVAAVMSNDPAISLPGLSLSYPKRE